MGLQLSDKEEKFSVISRGGAGEAFRIFLRLGLTSFGGPIAHLGYFHEEFVRRRGWFDDASFAQLLSVCQFLPGPVSSQMGFAIGLYRAGWRGALAAFIGFTFPSALLMFGFALYAPRFFNNPAGLALIHSLKLVAVVVVAHGLFGMIRTLTPDVRRLMIAAGACGLVVLGGSAWWQLFAIVGGGVIGIWLCRSAKLPDVALPLIRYKRRYAIACFSLFLVGLAVSLTPHGSTSSLSALAAAFYKAGALVFGGGHVVLPLLKAELVAPGLMSTDAFLAGYGAAQAVPGPMFSLSAYLGATTNLGIPPVLGAIVALGCIFLPGFLLLMAALPAWNTLVHRPWAASLLAGVNAAVVGLLAAAFYDPVWREGITSIADIVIVAIGLFMLFRLRLSSLSVVGWCVVTTVAWIFLFNPTA